MNNRINTTPTEVLSTIWQALEEVCDPEIPVVSLVEMGIIRNVEISQNQTVTVTITPTFTGCPAQFAMKEDIINRIHQIGYQDVEVRVVLSPPWTTDWITPETREKLRSFGLATPAEHGGDFELSLYAPVECPFCGSHDNLLRNRFGPTPCRSLHYCNQCQQPFEQIKPA